MSAETRAIQHDEYLDGLSVEQRTKSWARGLAMPAERGQARLVVETDGGEVVGFVVTGPTRSGEGTGEVQVLNVDPGHWRSGFGRLLLAAAEDALRGGRLCRRHPLGLGWRWGAAAGALVALSRLFGLLAPDVSVLDDMFNRAFYRPPPRFLSVVSNLALYCLAGAGIAHLSVLQRRAERQESTAKAREELARGLHDGVLQTLALVQRQASDPSLVQMARDTDRELRGFLYDPGDPRPSVRLAEALTASAHQAARRFGIDPALVLDPDLPELDGEVVTAAAGAVSEALANAAKHAGATHVTVYAGIEDDEVLVSVHDDGRGIDLANAGPGAGIASSIQARITDAGGRAEVRSSPGQGTEVCL